MSIPAHIYENDECTVRCIIKQIISCIDSLHKIKYIHRDIKPGNFVWRNSCDIALNELVMIDFGLSFSSYEFLKNTEAGSPGFMATGIY